MFYCCSGSKIYITPHLQRDKSPIKGLNRAERRLPCAVTSADACRKRVFPDARVAAAASRHLCLFVSSGPLIETL